MGVIEKSIALTSKDGEGNQLLFLPYTKVDNVEGAIDEAQLQNYVTNQELEESGYVTETELSAKNYATTSQLPSVMVGATSALVGSEGLVPAPAKGFQARFLRGDGTWQIPTDSKTQQTKKTDDNEYPILAKLTANETNATAGASFAGGVTINPSTGTITANTFNGTATKAIVADAADSVNWSGVQNKPTIPTKVSQLTNDSGFLTSIPSEYITEIELNEKGFLTNVDLLPYAKTETVNQLLNQKVSTSEMINYVTYDSLSKQGFITKDDLPSKFIVSIEIQGNKLICHFNDLTSSEFELYKTGTEAPVWK